MKYSKKFFEYLFIIGGDGTYIRNINKFVNKNIKVIGINSGTLGFYSSLDIQELLSFGSINDFEKNNFYHPSMLEIIINKKTFYCLNEIVIHSLNTISFDIHINNIFYERFYGTGILLTTPTGTTGYNKSVNGSLLFPKCELFQLTEIAPLNNLKIKTIGSPIVLDKSVNITISNVFAKPNMSIVIDGEPISVKDDSQINISLIQSNLQIWFPHNTQEYIEKIRKVFL